MSMSEKKPTKMDISSGRLGKVLKRNTSPGAEHKLGDRGQEPTIVMSDSQMTAAARGDKAVSTTLTMSSADAQHTLLAMILSFQFLGFFFSFPFS